MSAFGGTATMTGGCAGGVVVGGLAPSGDGTLRVTGGQIRHRILTSGIGRADIGSVKVGLLADGTVSPSYLVEAKAQSVLELNGTELQREVRISDLATLKLNDATVHGSVNMVDGSPLVFPKKPTVIMNGGTVDDSIEAYTVNITGGNIGGGVKVFGIGAVGTIGAANITGQVSAGGGTGQGGVTAIVGISGGKIGGTAANGASISVNDAEITGAATVAGLGLDLGTLTITGGQVVDVSARGLNSPTALNGFAKITGSTITGNVHAHDGSEVTLISGTVAGEAIASGSTSTGGPGHVASVLKIQGGSVGNAKAVERGQLDLSSGTVTGNLSSEGSGRILLSGGTVQGNLVVEGASGTFQSGGEVAGQALVQGFFTKRFEMTGGRIAKDVSTSGGGQIFLRDGAIGGDLAIEGSYGEVNGGTVSGALIAKGGTFAKITGGTFAKGVEARDTGFIEASGGTINSLFGIEGTALAAIGGSTVNLTQNVVVAGHVLGLNECLIDMSGGSVLGGANLHQKANLVLSGNATLIDGDLTANDAGIVSIAGGNVNGHLNGFHSSTVFMTGGRVTGSARALQTDPKASFTVEGGQIDGLLTAFESSIITMNGGTVLGSAEAQESSKLTVNGGNVGGDLAAFNNATIEMSGMPSIEGFLKANGDSTINASGGTVRRATASENAKLNLSGIVFSAGDLTGGGDSRLTMSGGTVGADLIVSEQANMEMSGGLVEGAGKTQGGAYLGMSGGRINGPVESANTNPEFGGLDVSGGVVGGDFISRGVLDNLKGSAVITGNLICSATSTTSMSGGTVHQHAVGRDRGTLYISSGAVAFDVEAQNNSTVNLAGGFVGRDLRGFHNGRINMSGGIVQRNLEGFNTSVITKSGGCVFGQTIPHDQCTLKVSGGPCGGGPGGENLEGSRPDVQPQALSLNITVEDEATVKFIGTDLTATLVDPNHTGLYSLYELTGTLADGTEVSGGQFLVRNQTGAQFKLVPFVPADLDRDGDVDSDDAVKFQDCATGPALGPVAANCEPADLDKDGDADQADFAVIQRCMAGPEQPADPNCSD